MFSQIFFLVYFKKQQFNFCKQQQLFAWDEILDYPDKKLAEKDTVWYSKDNQIILKSLKKHLDSTDKYKSFLNNLTASIQSSRHIFTLINPLAMVLNSFNFLNYFLNTKSKTWKISSTF